MIADGGVIAGKCARRNCGACVHALSCILVVFLGVGEGRALLSFCMLSFYLFIFSRRADMDILNCWVIYRGKGQLGKLVQHVEVGRQPGGDGAGQGLY